MTTAAVQQAVESVVRPLDGAVNECPPARVTVAEPVAVVGALAAGNGGPDIWIPDSSVWVTQATADGARLDAAGSFGSTPVIVAADSASAGIEQWVAAPPSWPAVLASGHGLATPDTRTYAPSFMALASARAAAGPDPAVTRRLTAAVTLAQQRDAVATLDDGLAAVSADTSPIGPLVVAGRADVRRAMTAVQRPGVVEVVPVGGPVLDYPIVVAGDEGRTAARARIDGIVAALLSPDGIQAATAAGLDRAAATDATTTLSAADLNALSAELEVFARPSQILVVVDVSTSMIAEVSPGVTRADVATQALTNALVLLPDASRVGFWRFASNLDGDLDYTVAQPISRLDAPVGDGSARAALAQGVAQLPDSLVPGGTSLYDVTLAAMAAAQAQWDPDVVTTVALITDGKNEDSTGLTLDQLTAALQAGGDKARPVGLVAVAFGPDADLATLQTITASAAPWGPAQAVDAKDPSVLAAVLLAALSARG